MTQAGQQGNETAWPDRAAGRGYFLRGLSIQMSVLEALILRELQGRFGRDNIGYLWMIAEPMTLAAVITTLHFITHFGTTTPGMGPFPFTLLGYCLFIIFRNSFNRADGAINGSNALLYHAPVKPFDIMLAKSVVETVGAVSALVILMTIGIMLGLAELPARPLYLFAAAFAIAWWTFGLSLIIASYTYKHHVLGRFVHQISYFMFPLSGAFVTMDFLPAWAQDYMAWNPMMSMFEMARYGYFLSATDRHIFPGYIVAHCAASTYWGLIALRGLRNDIHVS